MAKKHAPVETEVREPVEEVKSEQKRPLSVQELFDFIESRGAEKVQLIRVTGQGRLDATVYPKDTGNLILVVEVNPAKGIIV